MPITNSSQLMRFEMCGAEIPRWVRLKLASFGDDSASIKAFGLTWFTQMCERLLAGGARVCILFAESSCGNNGIWKRLLA